MSDVKAAPILVRRWGPWRRSAALGTGGFGAVFLAEDPVEGRRAAVKCHPGTGRSLARFHREYLLLQRLDHPAIPLPHELGVLPDGGGWFAMGLAAGRSPIAAVRDAGPPGAPARVAAAGALLHDLLAAVEVLHARGVVHCDLKAGNVRVDDVGHVTLLDLGGAQVVRPDGSVVGGLGRVATATAAALEQHVGADVDPRTDLHALGVLAWRLLCDDRPFAEADDPVATLVDARPAPPHERVPGVPTRLSGLVVRLLALAPADRPASAAAARVELEALGFRGVGWAEPDTWAPDDVGPEPVVGEVAALLDRGALTAADRAARRAGPPVTAGRALARARVDVALGRHRRAVRYLRPLLTTSLAVDAACALARAAEALGDPALALTALADASDDRFARARVAAWRARLLADAGRTDEAEDAAVAASAGLASPDPRVRAEVAAALLRAAPDLAPPDDPWLRTAAGRSARLDHHVARLRAALARDDVDAAASALAAATRLAGWIRAGLSSDDRAAQALDLATRGVW